MSGSPAIPSSSDELTVAAVGANLQLFATAQCAILSRPTQQIQCDEAEEQRKKQRLLPLEIIEHDSVRHDLAEAGHRVELGDELCAQTERIDNQERHTCQ